ncbi:hypothetical protein DAPPUDRAFT_98865 [Daphnia pulex]|uniref:CCHC-type domain-containing protein n=1 Tax=Daphnia pulex TaxID=6669 RepID=E9G4L9_DAPPU|nr:hypothetical protein DAPPUDRAFT_98865 [Daphnia pulex]|eukprot:EFX85320.1 hypothetical protein DAPPUDRAFT_98865 [Daphnia pulex]
MAYLSVKCNDLDVTAVIGTSWAFTAISPDFLFELNLVADPLTGSFWDHASEGMQSPMGSVEICISVEGSSATVRAAILRLHGTDLILGLDCLSQLGTHFTIGNAEFSIRDLQSENLRCQTSNRRKSTPTCRHCGRSGHVPSRCNSTPVPGTPDVSHSPEIVADYPDSPDSEISRRFHSKLEILIKEKNFYANQIINFDRILSSI